MAAVANGQTYPQHWDITAENMTTGAFSGADIAGSSSFSVVGTVTGHTLVETTSAGSYVAHGVATLTVTGTTVQMVGSFKDSNGTSGTFAGTLQHIRLSGTVYMQEGGASTCRRTPRRGVAIQISGAASVQTATGAHGTYAVVLAPGSYRVTPSEGSLEFDPAYRDVTLQASLSGVDFTTCGGSGSGPHGNAITAPASVPHAHVVMASASGAPSRALACDMGVTWTMPDRLSLAVSNMDPNDGMLRAGTGLNDATPSKWRVNLNLTKGGVAMQVCPANATYHWTLSTAGSTKTRQAIGPCKLTMEVPQLGVYQVKVVRQLPNGKKGAPITGKIVVRDWLIIGLGDSNASGQGNPRFFYHKCERSIHSYQYLVAKYLEEQDHKSSVTFLFASCSGARVEDLIDHSYQGQVPTDPPAVLLPQLRQVMQRLGTGPNRRKVAAVLLSIGVNDIEFGPVLDFCGHAAYLSVGRRCYATRVTTKLTPVTHDLTISASSDPKAPFLSEQVTAWAKALPGKYARLNAALKSAFAPNKGAFDGKRVFITTYPSFWTDAHGQVCTQSEEPFPHFWSDDWTWLSQAGGELDQAVASTAAFWTPVLGIGARFTGHGYCSSNPWIQSIAGSKATQGDQNGAFHATFPGQQASAHAVEPQLCAMLYTTTDCTRNPR